MELIKNKDYQVEITALTSEGNGVCRIDGYTVFVPNTAVNDTCIIKLIKMGKSYGYGKLIAIIKASEDRISESCEVFSRCGGCALRHISYEAELGIKNQTVKDCFKRIGGFDFSINNIIGSNEIDGYRNKAQYPVTETKNGLISGFYAARSHRIIESKGCMLQPSIFHQIQQAVLDEARALKIDGYDEIAAKGLLRHIYLRYAKASGEIMLCLVARKNDVRFKEIAEKIMNEFKEVTTIVLNINSENSNIILGKKFITLTGSGYITDILLGKKFRISAASFYQVNHSQAERLYSLAYEYANVDKETTLIDLYCGVGTIGLCIASKIKKLIGVEIVQEAIDNAVCNAKINNITNAEFICADAGKAAINFCDRKIMPDVIIIDPPRKGIDEKVVDAICVMSPERVVMISCNPSTAARDCKRLCEKGYTLSKVTPVDMFPRTNHIECVVLMSRQKA